MFEKIIKNLPSHIRQKLEDLKGLRERPDFHPEENCFEHIRIVTERCIKFGDKDLIMTALFHDIHKLDTMKINVKTGHPTSPGHDKWSQKTVLEDKEVGEFITDFGSNIQIVSDLCGQHMRIHQIGEMRKVKQMRMVESPFFSKLSVFSKFDNMLFSDTEAMENADKAFKCAEWSKENGELHPFLMGKYLDKGR